MKGIQHKKKTYHDKIFGISWSERCGLSEGTHTDLKPAEISERTGRERFDIQ